MFDDVAPLVLLAALDQRRGPEGLDDRLAQRLATVDHPQDPLFGVEAAVDQVREQRPRHRRVLGRALPEAERQLLPLGRDPEGDDVGPRRDLERIDHHRREADV